jgi:hypothetical protein
MRRLALTLIVTTVLASAASALAASPTPGPFAGKTSLHTINGFPDVVTFTAGRTGKSLTRFRFGTLGCFGTGAFAVGVDPYELASSVGVVKSIPLSKTGTFSVTVKPAFAETDGIVTTATIAGQIVNRTNVSGTITISQQGASGDTCGPEKMKFSAVPGTPDSLGLTGP